MTNIEKFDLFYKTIFKEIDLSHKIIVGGAHLYNLEEKKRLHQYFYVDIEFKKNNLFDSLNEAFFKIEDRAKFFEIINIMSRKKRQLLWKRVSLSCFLHDFNNHEDDYILIPEDIFLKGENFISTCTQEKKNLKDYLKEKWNEIQEKNEWRCFHSYLSLKLMELIESDISKNYKSPFDIFVMINSIMFYDWKFLHFFPTDPPGGFFVILNDALNEKEIEYYYEKAQRITNELSLGL